MVILSISDIYSSGKGAGRREEVFSKAFDRQQRLDDVLEKKFEEARKKAEKDKSKPFNPFDGE